MPRSTTYPAFKDTEAQPHNRPANLRRPVVIPRRDSAHHRHQGCPVELPDDLKMVTGDRHSGIPYSINDVKFTVEGEVTKVAEQALTSPTSGRPSASLPLFPCPSVP